MTRSVSEIAGEIYRLSLQLETALARERPATFVRSDERLAVDTIQQKAAWLAEWS